MASVRPIITTPDLTRLRTFYERLLGAVEVRRFPEDGPTLFIGLKASALAADPPIGVCSIGCRTPSNWAGVSAVLWIARSAWSR